MVQMLFVLCVLLVFGPARSFCVISFGVGAGKGWEVDLIPLPTPLLGTRICFFKVYTRALEGEAERRKLVDNAGVERVRGDLWITGLVLFTLFQVP